AASALASAKDDGLVPVEHDAPLGVPLDRTREHDVLDVAPECGERGDVHRVIDALDVLLDDRTLVERTGDVMRGGADQLDATVVRLAVGPGALEAGQERVVDVDRTPLELSAEVFRQD